MPTKKYEPTIADFDAPVFGNNPLPKYKTGVRSRHTHNHTAVGFPIRMSMPVEITNKPTYQTINLFESSSVMHNPLSQRYSPALFESELPPQNSNDWVHSTMTKRLRKSPRKVRISS